MNDINESKEVILEIINSNIENVQINLGQSGDDLSTMGMDSITFIRIVVELEDAFNIEIPDEFLLITEMNTVEKMLNIVLSTMTNTEPTNTKQ